MDQMQAKLRQAQLTALRNEITPHYLVNTLDAIRMKLLLDGQTESAQLLQYLQTSLRTYGFSPDDTLPLSQELSFLEDTLKLHQFRFLGKLTWTFSLAPQTENLQIPRFLLQPIVENSLRHGLHADMDAPHLTVAAWLEEDFLCLSVSDNGIGFSQGASTFGTGLRNVAQRLRLHYGEHCNLEIQSVPNSGSLVILRLPGKGKVSL